MAFFGAFGRPFQTAVFDGAKRYLLCLIMLLFFFFFSYYLIITQPCKRGIYKLAETLSTSSSNNSQRLPPVIKPLIFSSSFIVKISMLFLKKKKKRLEVSFGCCAVSKKLFYSIKNFLLIRDFGYECLINRDTLNISLPQLSNTATCNKAP